MKTNILKITALSLFAAALVVAPATVRAEDTNAPAASGHETKAQKKIHETLPFHGKLAAVDKTAMTITVAKRTFEITSETKISKDGIPATLGDAVVGETVSGAYKKGADGKLSATTVNLGKKPEGENPAGASKKKKKDAAE
jgi:hypothetical protein